MSSGAVTASPLLLLSCGARVPDGIRPRRAPGFARSAARGVRAAAAALALAATRRGRWGAVHRWGRRLVLDLVGCRLLLLGDRRVNGRCGALRNGQRAG